MMRTFLRRSAAKIRNMLRSNRADIEMEREIASHVALLEEEYERRGMSAEEARVVARRTLGGAEQARQLHRDARTVHWLEQIRRDVRFGLFQLWKAPGFALTAILTLALGVGANVTIFSMINGLLLRPLAVPESGRLIVLSMNRGGPQNAYSFPESIFRGLEHRGGALGTVFAFDRAAFQVKSGSSTEVVYGQYVSGSFFAALETPPLLGRVLTPQDDRKGGDPSGYAAVISESLWNNRFHRDSSILGHRIVIDNVAFTIVGVMPGSFFGADPIARPQLFVPLTDEEALAGDRSMIKFAHHAWWLSVMGRLAPGATIEQANSQVGAATDAVLSETVPDAEWIKRMKEHHFTFLAESASTGSTQIRLRFRKPLIAVLAMCGGILLLACLNLASLLMARGTARQRELATRMALGASRGRLVRQLLVEGLLLGVTGTAAGLALAPLVSQFLVSVLLGGTQGVALDTSLDWRVFTFAAAGAILATILFALLPAIKATSRGLMDRIKDGQHTTLTCERRAILPRILLGAEVGLALILVVGAGLVATSLVRLYTSGEGFDPRGIENIAFRMDNAGLKGDALIAFYQQMAERLARLPGVTGVSYQRVQLFTRGVWDEDFADVHGTSHDTYVNAVAPAYFSTMRIPLLAGREFTWRDTTSSGLKVILNHSAARQLFPDGNALGRSIRHDQGKGVTNYEVVGIVGDAKYDTLRSAAPPSTAYFAIPQQTEANNLSYIAEVRTTRSAAPLAPAVRAITAEMAPQVPVPETTAMTSVIDDSLSAERMMTMLAVFFAICALVVTAIGLYGTLAYATARRTPEIGIRMALGARRFQVAAMVFRQNLWVVMAGTVIGLAAALIATRALASFLFQTTGHDPWVLAASILGLALTACAASLLPALRAARIEPMVAIRCE